MKVSQLIAALSAMPQDAEVLHLWDGEPRTAINHLWISRGGDVVTADDDQVCYSTGARPESAPTEEEDPYWRTARSAGARSAGDRQ